MIEEWKDIQGYKGHYQVSNLGRVKSLARYKGKNNTRYFGEDIILKCDTSTGYNHINLWKDGKVTNIKNAILTVKAFIPNLYNKPCINHKDGIKLNDNITNLEWCTYKENNQHAWRTGLSNSDSTDKEVIMFSLSGKKLSTFRSSHEASRQSNINRGNITSCCLGNRKTAGGFKWVFGDDTL